VRLGRQTLTKEKGKNLTETSGLHHGARKTQEKFFGEIKNGFWEANANRMPMQGGEQEKNRPADQRNKPLLP